MSVVKSILRWFLGLQAIGLLILSVAVALGSLTARRHAVPTHGAIAQAIPVSGLVLAYCIVALIIALGPIYAMAWWTTRKPAAKIRMWALAASALNVALGIFLEWASYYAPKAHTKVSPVDGLWCFAFGLAGLFVFSRRETPTDPALDKPKAISVSGDRTSTATRHTVTALSTVTQIAALIFWSRWAVSQHLMRHHGLAWIILITAAEIVCTVIHECGHAILAWCFEMKLLSFKAGPLQWVSREGNWNFKFSAAGLFTPGGCVSAAPTRPDQPAWEFLLMIAAGPGANLLFGAACFWAVLHDRWGSYQQTWEFFAYTGAFCLIGAFLNLIPFLSEQGSYSDGARILQIVTHSPLAVAGAVSAPSEIEPEATPNPLAVTPPPPMSARLVPQISAVLSAPTSREASNAKPASRSTLTPAMADISNPIPASFAAAAPPVVLAAPKLAPVEQSPILSLAAVGKPVPAPATISQQDTAARAVSAIKPEQNPTPPVSTSSPSKALTEKPLGTLDEMLAARMQAFFERPSPPPAAKTKPAGAVVRIPENPIQTAPVAAVKQETVLQKAFDVTPSAEPKLADPSPLTYLTTAPAAVATPIAVQTAGIATAWESVLPPPATASTSLLGSRPTPPAPAPELPETGVIASSTRIPTSALNIVVKPPAIRLATNPTPPSPAPGSKVSVPSAFARRPRPAPLTSAAPGIEEIIAAAAKPEVSVPAETAIVALPAAREIVPPAAILPAAIPRAPTVTTSEPAPVGLIFSEAWPPRPAAASATVDRKEMHAASPTASALGPVPATVSSIESTELVEKPFPPQSEKPRYDPLDFLRAAALESFNAP